MTGYLYIVATPIGNINDVTLRALDTLREVDIIFAESIERTKKLLSHYSIDTKIDSFNKDNEDRKIKLIKSCLDKSMSIALVTDAGTPSISDPGYSLLYKIGDESKIIAIPGPSSLCCALSISKIPMNSFSFLGFLPKKQTDRLKILQDYFYKDIALCVFESKHRLIALLEDIKSIYGGNLIVGIYRELTKIHETIIHDKVINLIKHYNDYPPKGEFIVIISASNVPRNIINDYQPIIKKLRDKSYSNKDIVDILHIITGDTKKDIYKSVLTIRHDT